MNEFLSQFQRYLVYILRHHPEEICLELGKDGFVEISDLMEGIKISHKYCHATEAMVFEVVENQPDKKRLEIQGRRIRARYGHSNTAIEEEIEYPSVKPPKFLYHGTTIGNKNSILENGLLPVSRKYVHLSEDPAIATRVARRHSKNIVIFTIICEKAIAAGIEFYHPEDLIWLVKSLPPQFLQLDRS